MELELWKLSRVVISNNNHRDTEEEDNENKRPESRTDIIPSLLIDEIGSSEKFGAMVKKFLNLEPPINLWVEDDTINIESTSEKSIRYELFGCDIEDKNIVDATFKIFENLEYLYSCYSKK
jgi:hypothetical protein